ncbi:MAG: cell division protein SepF [Oscillospiraceae bacterium]|nr:cell division protein SepF [Oscillospiraceae bacterium]MBQ8800944.1 cell division protein SepF [Clostridium sp.]
MSFWDNVKKFAQPYSDDEFDDYDEDDYMDDYEEPAEPQPRRRRPAAAPAPAAPAAVEDDDAFSGFTTPAPTASPAASTAPSVTTGSFSGRVVSTSTAGKQEVILFRPVNFNDASKAADDLRARKVVVVNLENVDKAMARRVVDFLTGCVYSIDGSVKKIAQAAYLFCPSHLFVTGDLESLQAEVESYV